MSEAMETQGAEAAGRRIVKERRARVVSAKSQQTVIVVVERRVKHPKYKKFITVRKRFAAHDTLGCREGDLVMIKETRPMSKTKRWRVYEKIEQHA